ncbi:hmg box transcriptional [Stagonosporopsis vannaccii]|nr:hmg box transcriptional [Stagonosporopsis vannaccii]
MASCVLPPIRSSPPPPPPVVTFFSVPRRYVKSNMQVGDDKLQHPTEEGKAGRSLRKSTRNQIPRSAPDRSPEQRTKEEEQSMPASPDGHRRRNQSLEADGKVEENLESASPAEAKTPASVGSTGSGDLSPHVCLCQPEPKIPRPRNAFILYRQHHQQNIIRRNPGLNNPDISKIIGEQWKAESDEEKKVWQDLAQEEKARHHEQYPDYRYQPRRINKPGASPLNPSGQHTTVDKYRCPKCGGRSIKTPTSPYPAESQGTPTLPPPNTSEGLTPTTRYLPMMSSLSLDSPVVPRRGPGPSRLSNIQIPQSIREHEMYSPLTPGQKRRRFDYGPPPSARRPEGPYYPQSAARRESLPPIHVRVSPPNTAGMHPPSARTPREARITQHEPPRKSSSSDMNVVVPQHHDQSRSVEAMVLSVPYQARIKLLGRICAPLKEPGPTSPAAQARGAIIAVEGDDLKAVQDLAEWLNEYLSKDEEYNSRVADPPQTPVDTTPDVSFEAYLDLIKEWHGKSKEMIRYITTPVMHSDSVSSKGEEMNASDRKDSATPPDSPRKSTSPSLTTSTRTSSSAPFKKPIIILPTFQLHASVAYASRIPIQDAYSPTDHWQWMATLWRGIVGPDLTLYVKSYDVKEAPQGKMVDLDDQVRCLTVMKAQGKPFADASLRRVGFEVGEWVRGIGARKDI